MSFDYEYGLHQISAHCHAWLQPDGSWGLNNAGLVSSGGESLLVDTAFDVAHTRRLLDALAPVTANAPIRRVFNTHADGDHCFGNQLLDASVEKIATSDAASRMDVAHLDGIRTRLASDAPGMDYMRHCFSPFDFSDIVPQPPDTTFDGQLSLTVGDVRVELIEMPPAHTTGDAVVFIPEDGVLFAGDVLFIDAAPIAWAGPLESWAQACEQLIALDPAVVVPGHGPITDVDGIARVRDYLRHVDAAARDAHARGLSVVEAAHAIDMSGFEHLRESGRLVQNVFNVYRHLDPDTPQVLLMQEIERYEAAR